MRCAGGLACVSCALAAATFWASAAQPADILPKLTEQSAQLFAAVATSHTKTPEDLDPQDTMHDPSFFVFYGLNQSPAIGGFGFFAVNRWTGDVWTLWGCYKLSTLALRKLQAQLRRHLTHEELKQFPRLARLKPECI